MEPNKKSKVSMMAIPSGPSMTHTKSLGTFKSQGTIRSTSRMKMRKKSYGYSSIFGIKNIEKNSQIGLEYRRPIQIFLNTYQLDPHVRFEPVKVLKAAEEMLDELFTNHKYNSHDSPALAIRIAGLLMRKVKAMNFNRYRIISVVTLGQKRAQSYNNAVAFLWDHERDNYINIQREVNTAFIQVTIFGIYLD